MSLVVLSWDGDTWTTRGRLEDASQEGTIEFLPHGSPWLNGVAELDGDSLRPIEVLASIGDGTPLVHAHANAPDGPTWVVVAQPGVTNGGLYVITPDAMAATE